MHVSDAVDRLCRIGARCGDLLAQHADQDVLAYLRGSVPVGGGQPPRARELLGRVLRKRVECYAPAEASHVAAQFQRAPMLQLADSASLLLDSETFLNNFMYQVACREHHHHHLLVQQCSTIKLLQRRRPPTGPAYVELLADRYKLFDVSTKRLASASVATLKHVEFVFEPAATKLASYANAELPVLADLLRGRGSGSASEAIASANIEIWQRLKMKARNRLHVFHEDLSCDVLAAYLRDASTPVIPLLFDADVRREFLDAKRQRVGRQDNFVLRDTTDFFWLVCGESLHPVRVIGKRHQTLIDAYTGQPVDLALQADDVVQALEERRVYPDLILGYACLSLFPGVVAFGGASQQEYLPQITGILLDADARTPFMSSADRARLQHDDLSRLIGPALVELDARQRRALLSLGPQTDLDAFERDVLHQPIRTAVGTGSYFDYLHWLHARRVLDRSAA